MYNNSLTGPLPVILPEPATKTKLEIFNVRNNKLSGSLPPNMGLYSRLRLLNVEVKRVKLVPA